MTERMIYTGGVELCTESFGDPTDPPILLIMGIGASMLWWEEGFCRLLVAGRIRAHGRHSGIAELVSDAAGVLDAYGILSAHIVGVSAAGHSRSCSRWITPTASSRQS